MLLDDKILLTRLSRMKKLFRHYMLILLLSYHLCGMGQNIENDSIESIKEAPPAEKINKDTRPFRERISLGGSTGFWIQPRQTHLEVAGMLAYHFPRTLTVGTGYRYIYTRNRVYGKNLNSYGPNLFARTQLTQRIYFWTEWENLKTQYAVQAVNNDIVTQSTHVNSFYAGLGYIRQLGRRRHGGMSFQLLYNFLYESEENSPYYSPVIYRVGYFF
jgi:hypothetical protein